MSPPGAGQAATRHTNEILLAGLRPGRDTFAVAEKRFKAKNLSGEPNSGSKEWRDDCSGRSIRLESSEDQGGQPDRPMNRKQKFSAATVSMEISV